MSDDINAQKSRFSQYYINAQESFLGELLGKYLERDAQARMAFDDVKNASEKIAEMLPAIDQREELKTEITKVMSNIEALKEQNEDLIKQLKKCKKERQLAQEENTNLRQGQPQKPKRGRPRKARSKLDEQHDTTQEV
jgi:regulator of replication initiation timing|tara:strand:- start:2828 stop:3241 length:414 start_codon:yes stop_codon:yes gene_type:complete